MIVVKIIAASLALWCVDAYVRGIIWAAQGKTREQARELGRGLGLRSLLTITAAVTTAAIIWKLWRG
jgi:hypothetical protein